MTAARRELIALLTLVGLTMLYFGRVLFTGRALYWGDLVLSFYPTYDVWKRSVLAGQLPLWNPYVSNGVPLLADAVYSPLYPSMLLNLVFPLHRALAVDLALHVFLLGAFTYAFLRQKGISPGPSFLGAVTWAFSGFVAVRLTQPSLLRTLAWAPLMLWAVERIGLPFKDRRAPLYVALLLAAQVLAGHLQTLLISTLLAFAYGIWRAAASAGPIRKSLRDVAVAFVVGGLLALMLSAVQVLPGIELIQHSDRSGGKSIQFAATFALPLRQLPMLLSPRLFGSPDRGLYWGEWLYWEMAAYFGVVAFLLAAVGLVRGAQRDRVFWAIMGAGGVALAMGKASLVYRLAYLVVPGLAYFRAPARFLLWYGWCVAVLAAYGAEWVGKTRSSSRRWWTIGLAIAVVGGLALYWAASGPGVGRALSWLASGSIEAAGSLPPAVFVYAQRLVKEVGVAEGRRFALLWLGGGLLIVGAAARRLTSRAALALLLILVTGDLFSFGLNFYPSVQSEELYTPVPTESLVNLEGGRYRILTTPAYFLSWSPAMSFSFTARQGEDLQSLRAALVPNMGTQRQIPNAGGYAPMSLARPLQFMSLAIWHAEQNAGRSPLLDFVGAKYIFTRTNLERTYASTYSGAFHVYRNDNALPRGYLITHYTIEPNDELPPEKLIGGFDPRHVVFLDKRPESTYGLRAATSPGTIVRWAYQPNKLSFGLALTAPAIFVLSDAYYPGWRAYVDGVEHPIYRANYAFRAVFLPVTARSLEFVFRPRSVAIGGSVSLASWSVLAVILLMGALRRRRPLPDDDQVNERVAEAP